MCSLCHKSPPRPRQRYCLKCHAEKMRDWRQLNGESEQDPQKLKARHYANVRQRRGKLHPLPCLRCGADKAEKHHPDYGQPFLVVWLCRPCHLLLHKLKRLLPNENLVEVFLPQVGRQ